MLAAYASCGLGSAMTLADYLPHLMNAGLRPREFPAALTQAATACLHMCFGSRQTLVEVLLAV